MPTDDKFTVEAFNERNAFGRETWVYAAVDEIKLLRAKVEALTADNERLRVALGIVKTQAQRYQTWAAYSGHVGYHHMQFFIDRADAALKVKTLDNPAPSPAQEGGE